MSKKSWMRLLALLLVCLLPVCALAAPRDGYNGPIPSEVVPVEVTPAPKPTLTPVPTITPAPVPGADVIYGWVTMGGKALVPVASVNNAVYMEDDFSGNHAGQAPKTPYQVIYDYDCRKGTTYAALNSMFTLSTLKQYPIVEYKVALQDEVHRYVVIAMFHTENTPQAGTYFAFDRQLDTAEKYDAFLAEVLERSVYALPAALTQTAQAAAPVTEEAAADADAPAETETEAPAEAEAQRDNLLVIAGDDLLRQGMKQVLVCRELRADETAESVTALMQQATRK